MQLIQALSLDLDDTLWPIAPAMIRAEQALHGWLCTHCPDVAEAYPVEAMRALRDRVHAEHPELAHDFTALRKISLARAFHGSAHDEARIEHAFEEFYRVRNEVELYPDAGPALASLARRWPIVSLTNGNADLHRIGLAQHFKDMVHARSVGAAKPERAIFLIAAERLALPPERIAHVGDDPELDVVGAKRAGMVAVWLNRDALAWPIDGIEPDVTVATLTELEPALDRWQQMRARALEHAA